MWVWAGQAVSGCLLVFARCCTMQLVSSDANRHLCSPREEEGYAAFLFSQKVIWKNKLVHRVIIIHIHQYLRVYSIQYLFHLCGQGSLLQNKLKNTNCYPLSLFHIPSFQPGLPSPYWGAALFSCSAFSLLLAVGALWADYSASSSLGPCSVRTACEFGLPLLAAWLWSNDMKK